MGNKKNNWILGSATSIIHGGIFGIKREIISIKICV